MNARLHEYAQQNVPALVLTKPVMSPVERKTVIGHEGFDKAHRDSVATFPKKKSEHKFRGESSSGLTGYGLSEDVLEAIEAEMIFFIELEEDRVIQYHRTAFSGGTTVAYSPQKNDCVIGVETMRVDDDVYHDRQRVVPVSNALQTYDRDDLTITQ
jgi:hypothetical protein